MAAITVCSELPEVLLLYPGPPNQTCDINHLSYADDTTLMAERVTKKPLDEGERGE